MKFLALTLSFLFSVSAFTQEAQTLNLNCDDSKRAEISLSADNVLKVTVYNEDGNIILDRSGQLSDAIGGKLNGNMTQFHSDEGLFYITTGLVPNSDWFSSQKYDRSTSIHLTTQENYYGNHFLSCTH